MISWAQLAKVASLLRIDSDRLHASLDQPHAVTTGRRGHESPAWQLAHVRRVLAEILSSG